jgi:hypothetical protein
MYVTVVTFSTTMQTIVVKSAPCAQILRPVKRIGIGIVVLATGGFSVRSVLKIIWNWGRKARQSVSGDRYAQIVLFGNNRFKFCSNCNRKTHFGHFCYVAPLKATKLSEKIMYIFFDTECTQDLEELDESFEHVPILICAQQMFSKCVSMDDTYIDCKQCGPRTHEFCQDNVCKFIDYLRLSKSFADKIYVISHNSRGYDAQFLLKRFLELRWEPRLIMDGFKILSMVVENINFLDSLNFLPMTLKSMPK